MFLNSRQYIQYHYHHQHLILFYSALLSNTSSLTCTTLQSATSEPAKYIPDHGDAEDAESAKAKKDQFNAPLYFWSKTVSRVLFALFYDDEDDDDDDDDDDADVLLMCSCRVYFISYDSSL